MNTDFIFDVEASFDGGWKLPEQTYLVDLIVKGTVKSIGDSFMVGQNNPLPNTPVIFNVNDIYFGNCSDTLNVNFPGGEVLVSEYLSKMDERPDSKNPFKDLTKEEEQTKTIGHYTYDYLPLKEGQEMVLLLIEDEKNPGAYFPKYWGKSIYYVDEKTNGIASPGASMNDYLSKNLNGLSTIKANGFLQMILSNQRRIAVPIQYYLNK